MKAVALVGAKNAKLIEIDKPKSENGNVIIKTLATAICGSDLQYWNSGDQTENNTLVIRGHEVVGLVDDPGSREDLQVGQRVWIIPGNPCGECFDCQNGRLNLCEGCRGGIGEVPEAPGSFQEYFSIRPDMVFPMPEEVTDLEAAVFEPCAVAHHCFTKSNADVDQPLLIVGAGPIGILTALWAKHGGVKKVVMADVNTNRLAIAKKLGVADETYSAASETYVADLRKASGGHGFAQCIDCVALADTINTELEVVSSYGRIVVVGYPRRPLAINIHRLLDHEIELAGSYGYNYDDMSILSFRCDTTRVGHTDAESAPFSFYLIHMKKLSISGGLFRQTENPATH